MFFTNRFLLLAILALCFTACKNNDNVFKKQVSSFFKVINGTSDTLNYFLNGTRLNNGSSLVPGGATYYNIVPTGSESFQFKRNNTADVLLTQPVTLKDSLNYSYYLVGPAVDQSFMTIDTLLPATKADTLTQLKFVQASPDAGTLTVLVGDTVNYKSRAFKTASVFLTFGSGLKRVRVYQEGSSTAKIDTPLTLRSDHIYTLYTFGKLNGTGTSQFKVGLTLNL